MFSMDYDPESAFVDKVIRRKFIGKVYTILSFQLAFNFMIICFFTFFDALQEFGVLYNWLIYIFLALFFTTYIALICCSSVRRNFPYNLILLVIMTVSMSFITGFATIYFNTASILYSVGITAGVTISVTIFAILCPCDITKCGLLILVLSIFFSVFAIISLIVVYFTQSSVLTIVFCGLGALLFTLYLAYDTQMIIGGRRVSLSPDEYLLGAIHLYIDVVNIFLDILGIMGLTSE